MRKSSRFALAIGLAAAICAQVRAAVPPPDKLLPKDTMLVLTAPDWSKGTMFSSNQPFAKMWRDPAMKPFRDKFVDKLETSVVGPLEKSLGFKLADYMGLANGQVTFAVIPVTPKSASDAPLALVFLMESKDHAADLKSKLADITKKWTDASKPLKSEKIRSSEFNTFFISQDDLSMSKIFPGAKEEDAAAPSTNKIALTIGQSDTLLVVSTSPEAVDKILGRQSGGMIPALEESPQFAADYGARLRESPAYFWMNSKGAVELLAKAAAAGDDSGNSPFHLDTIIGALGLSTLNSVSLAYKTYPEGEGTQFFMAMPQDKRPPLLKMLIADAKDSSPPSFVPADAVKFTRWRLNIQRSWKTLQDMLNDVVPPQIMAQINMVFGMAGKDKDEKYDLKAELLDNMGDDIITYSKAPKGHTFADLKEQPSIILLSSPNPDRLVAAVKVVLSIPLQGAPIAEREFLGRKIYSISSPAVEGKAASPMVSFTASGGYLAVSSDNGILEEFIRSGDSKGKSLSDMPGLADAAQKVGGMGTGLFGFENDVQTMRFVYETLRTQPFNMTELMGTTLPPGLPMMDSVGKTVNEWLDFTLLPPFDAVSKYFHFTVYSGVSSPEGYALKGFSPSPPKSRQ